MSLSASGNQPRLLQVQLKTIAEHQEPLMNRFVESEKSEGPFDLSDREHPPIGGIDLNWLATKRFIPSNASVKTTICKVTITLALPVSKAMTFFARGFATH